MKRLVVAFFLPLVVFAAGSCKKTSTAMSAVPGIYIPWNMDSLMPGVAIYYNGVSRLNVSGVLVACKLTGSLTDTSGYTNMYTRNWEAAVFGNPPGSLTSGVSSVSVNSVPLTIGDSYCFSRNDSIPVWDRTASNHWYTSGSGTIPSFSADVDGVMPVFTGTLPVSISRASDLRFTFDSTNTANGDSAFVIVYGEWPAVQPLASNAVSAKGGTAVISVAQLSHFQNADLSFSLNGSTSMIYSDGLIMLVIYNHTIQTFGGKQFAFVKQREVLGVVKFL